MSTTTVTSKVLCFFVYYDTYGMGPHFDSRMIEVYDNRDIEREFELVVTNYAKAWGPYSIGPKPVQWRLVAPVPYERSA